MSRSAAAASIARPIPAIPETTAPLNLAEHEPTRKCCKINVARKWNTSTASNLVLPLLFTIIQINFAKKPFWQFKIYVDIYRIVICVFYTGEDFTNTGESCNKYQNTYLKPSLRFRKHSYRDDSISFKFPTKGRYLFKHLTRPWWLPLAD